MNIKIVTLEEKFDIIEKYEYGDRNSKIKQDIDMYEFIVWNIIK